MKKLASFQQLASTIVFLFLISFASKAQSWQYWEKYKGNDLGITDLHLDNAGNLWAIEGFNKIFRFDKDTTCEHWDNLNSILPEYFGGEAHFWIDRNDVVWLPTNEGVFTFNNGTWTKFATKSEAKGNQLAIDRNQHIWVAGFGQELREWDGTQWIAHQDVSRSYFLYVDDSNHVWAVNDLGTIKKYNGNTWKQYDKFNTTLSFDQLTGIHHMVQDGNGDYWFSNDVFNETYQFNENSNTWTVHTPQHLSSQKGMAVDLAGQIWIAEGSSIVKYANGSWTQLNPTIVGPFLMHDVVIDDDGTKWIGGQEGLLKYVDGGTGPIVLNIEKNNNESFNKIQVYPNPTQDGLFALESSSLGQLTVYNTHGKKVIESQITELRTMIDLSRHDSGVYILEIRNKNYTAHRQLIVD